MVGNIVFRNFTKIVQTYIIVVQVNVIQKHF